MNSFENGVVSYLGKENFEKISRVKVGIAGAGGLGSNCAFNLVRSGFKKFVIADFDDLEYSNLNRQFYFLDQVGTSKVKALKENLLRINCDLELEIISKKFEKKIDLNIFNDCDCIVEAVDKSSYKKMIVEKFMKSRKLLVAASGIAGFGNSDDLKIKKVGDNFYIVGDMVSGVGDELSPFSPYTNIAAAKQADIVFSYFINQGKRGIK